MSDAEAQYALSHQLWSEGKRSEAMAAVETALALRPDFAEAHYNRGAMLQTLNRTEEALAAYELVLALQPRLAHAWNNRGIALALLGRYAEAVTNYDRLLALTPHNAAAHYNRGAALQQIGRWGAAADSFARALSFDPRHADAFGCLAGAALHACDWKRVALLMPRLEEIVRNGSAVIAPLLFLGFSGDPALQLRCAENFVAAAVPRNLALPPRRPVRRERIRIAYLSSDFQDHATAYLAAELFERHDRSRFEVIGLSFGRPDDGAMRARIASAFDAFHDIATVSDAEAAKLLRALEVDIAIDLKGHTQGARPAILAHRSCPVQASYLGYPGTMGCDFIDYILADEIVVPREDATHFSEKIVHLPGCYQVNDSHRPLPPTPPRAELGLPQGAFVFCSFNNNWKITAPVFDVWMRLLAAVPGSVLWLLADNDEARRNLCLAAETRGIVSSRLVFAPRVTLAEHLARHGAADLFLDTQPYNAHTGASDALWMGLPLVTCLGTSFAGRVAASLLQAVGLPELATHNLADYESLALVLARDRTRLKNLRKRLDAGRATTPLFDADRFRRGLEAAYEKMWEIAVEGAGARIFPP
jgi:predicted O-linked N-acetylglucosamine transferase (SPINDLY family)